MSSPFAARWTPEDAAPEWMARALSPRDAVYEGFSPDLLFRENSRPFAWRTACRAEFLREQGLRFDESLRFGEDQAFHFAVYPRARKTVLSSQRLYEYRLDRPGSLMGTIQNDIVAKLDRHLAIVERIAADWRGGGLLDLCPAELVSFMVDFVAYDAVKLHDEDYRRIAGGLGDIFRSCWSSEAMREMGLEPAVADIAIRACLETDMPRRAARSSRCGISSPVTVCSPSSSARFWEGADVGRALTLPLLTCGSSERPLHSRP